MKTRDMFGMVACTLAAAMLCGLFGCSKEAETSNVSDRANAMEDFQAGRIDPAIAGFERVLKNDPKDYLAHFQLATLLQEQRKDYLGALVHFTCYLNTRPADDKTTIADDRINQCKDMLLAEHARKNGGLVASPAKPAEPDKKASQEVARLKKENATLQQQNKNLRYLLSKLGETGKKGHAPSLDAETRKLLAELRVSDAEEQQHRIVIPTDTELLDNEDDGGSQISSPKVQSQISDINRDEVNGSARTAIKKPAMTADELSTSKNPPPIKRPQVIVDGPPEPDPKPVPGARRGGGLDGLLGGNRRSSSAARPDTYTVQRGENLSAIAFRFYGSKGKWRDIQRANMATIPTTGEVHVGQTIKLP